MKSTGTEKSTAAKSHDWQGFGEAPAVCVKCGCVEGDERAARICDAASTLEQRVEELERRVAALEPPKYRKPFASSLVPQPCDCDRFGVVHSMTPECPVWSGDNDGST